MSKVNYIYLKEISDKGEVFNFSRYEDIGGRPDEFGLKSFNLNLRVQDAGEGYYINGTLKIIRNMPCTLCSLEADLAQEITIEEFLRIDPSFDSAASEVAVSDESSSLVIKNQAWNFLEFIRETINLEEPTQFYPKGEACKLDCPELLLLKEKGILTAPEDKESTSPFAALKNIQL